MRRGGSAVNLRRIPAGVEGTRPDWSVASERRARAQRGTAAEGGTRRAGRIKTTARNNRPDAPDYGSSPPLFSSNVTEWLHR